MPVSPRVALFVPNMNNCGQGGLTKQQTILCIAESSVIMLPYQCKEAPGAVETHRIRNSGLRKRPCSSSTNPEQLNKNLNRKLDHADHNSYYELSPPPYIQDNESPLINRMDLEAQR